MRSIIVAAIVLTSTAAFADRRAYVNTYEYLTNPRGTIELETYSTFRDANLATSVGDQWNHMFELEYGITDHWDVSLYQVVVQDPGKGLAYDGFKLRTRYRFGERGLFLVDPELYLEVIRTANFAKPWKVEGKVILAKSFGAFNVSTNLIYEQNASFKSVGPEFGYAVGAGWEYSPALKLGLEAFGTFEPEDGAIEAKNFVGPVVSFAGKSIWFAIGAGAGIGEHSESLRVRSILGIGL